MYNGSDQRTIGRARCLSGSTINGPKAASVDVDNDTPLLWVVREHLKLTGTNSMRVGPVRRLHGACRRQAVRSCQTTMGRGRRQQVTTIEACRRIRRIRCRSLGRGAGAAMRLLQSGQIMQAAELLARPEADARTDRRAHGRQHLPLRTYPRIVRAIERAARGA